MLKPFPLLPTSGTIPDEQIIGRDQEITKLLRLLRSQSVSVEEMRRMGKTLLLKKLAYLCNSKKLPKEFSNEAFKAKYISFQGKKNLGEVIDVIIKELEEFKEWHQIDFKKTYNLIRNILSVPEVEMNGTRLGLHLPEIKTSWKEIFFKILDDIAEVQAKKRGKLILIFDELPIMLWEWYKKGKHEEAMELLDILRERRQTLEQKGIRFIYCGSIGIKVVLNTFRKDFKYTGEPTNEMEEFNLNPFSEPECNFLCECFILSGFNIDNNEKEKLLKLVYELSNGLPFYISVIFKLIQTDLDYNITDTNISSAYNLIIHDTQNHKQFKQLQDRLEIYYPEKQTKELIKILNLLSKQSDFISEDDLFDQIDIDEKDTLKDHLYTLVSDHYLVRDFRGEIKHYKFKYIIFKEWWKINIA